MEVNCETDFVARTDDFKALVRNLAMQVAATRPLCVRREEVPADLVAKEREIFAEQMRIEGKPANVIEKIVEGKLGRFFSEQCLLEQPYIRDTERTVDQLIKDTIAKIGENVVVRRFSRFELGS